MKNSLTTMAGLFLGLTLVIVSIMTSGEIKGFLSISSFVVTIGGSFMALVVSEPMANLMKVPAVLRIAFSESTLNKADLIDLFIDMSKISKKEGFNSLENTVEQIDDKFLKKGILMVVDAMDTDQIKEILELEIDVADERHTDGQRIFKKWGEYAPSFGMIGTIIGLINMLGNLDDATTIGSGMAVALVTTFYGALFANLILLPIASNLENKANEEINTRSMMVEGILAIQEGLNPMVIEEKLQSFLSPKERLERKQGGNLKVDVENA